jgi:gas vesicle protein
MKNTSKILIAVGAGVVIGGVLGILFAPDKGTETRHKIAEAPKKLADTFKSKMKIGKEKLDETLDKINDRIEELA